MNNPDIDLSQDKLTEHLTTLLNCWESVKHNTEKKIEEIHSGKRDNISEWLVKREGLVKEAQTKENFLKENISKTIKPSDYNLKIIKSISDILGQIQNLDIEMERILKEYKDKVMENMTDLKKGKKFVKGYSQLISGETSIDLKE